MRTIWVPLKKHSPIWVPLQAHPPIWVPLRAHYAHDLGASKDTLSHPAALGLPGKRRSTLPLSAQCLVLPRRSPPLCCYGQVEYQEPPKFAFLLGQMDKQVRHGGCVILMESGSGAALLARCSRECSGPWNSFKAAGLVFMDARPGARVPAPDGKKQHTCLRLSRLQRPRVTLWQAARAGPRAVWPHLALQPSGGGGNTCGWVLAALSEHALF